MQELCKKGSFSFYAKGVKSLLLFLTLLILIPFSLATDLGYNNPTIPTLQPEIGSTGTILNNITNYSINVNSAENWVTSDGDLDNLDDIPWYTYVGNLFDQWLNTTDDVLFNSVNVTENLTVDGIGIFKGTMIQYLYGYNHVRLGLHSGTPRIIFEREGSTGQIDYNAETLRFIMNRTTEDDIYRAVMRINSSGVRIGEDLHKAELIVKGNVTADYFIGDGSNLTGISNPTLQQVTDVGATTTNDITVNGISIGDFLEISDDGADTNFDLTSGNFIFTGGDFDIEDTSPYLTLKDTSNSGTSSVSRIQFKGSDDVVNSWIGDTSSGDGNFEIRNFLDADLEFWTNNIRHMILDNVGNVGIGTANPGSNLEVFDSVDSTITIHADEGTANLNIDTRASSNNKFATLSFKDKNALRYAWIFRQATDDFYLYDYLNAKFVMRYDQSQADLLLGEGGNINVGIGTAPDEKLQVGGNIHINDNYKSLYGTGKDASETFDGTTRISNAELGSPEYNWTNYGGYNFDNNITSDEYILGKNQVTQYHRNATIDTTSANTWVNVTWDLTIDEETTSGYLLADSNASIVIENTGIYRIQRMSSSQE